VCVHAQFQPPKQTPQTHQKQTPQEATLKFNEDFSTLQPGDWVDVLCERNRVWYEARVVERKGEEVKVSSFIGCFVYLATSPSLPLFHLHLAISFPTHPSLIYLHFALQSFF
jgi:hypothetical protein